MFCPNCGNQLAENARFCANCGAPVNQAAQPADTRQPVYGYQYQAPSAEPKKPAKAKKNGKKVGASILGFLAAVAVYAVVRLAVGAVVGGVEEAVDTVQENREDAIAAQATPNPNYEAIFADNYIVTMGELSDYMGLYDYDSYAKEDEDGWIFRYEFAYDDDEVIVAMADTVFAPVEGYTEEEIESLAQSLYDNYADVDALDFCSVTTEVVGDYVKMVIRQEGMNLHSNVRALAENGYLIVDDPSLLLDMVSTGESLIADGYEKE